MDGKFKKSPIVVQSNKLVESRYVLTVSEQRLIFAVASMIHPDDVDFYPYEIKIRDLANILDIDLNNAYKNADRITDQLMQRVLVIPEDDGPLKVGWVSSCKYNNKKGSISFRFDPSLKPYLLQLKRDFTQSRLSIIAQFQSIYSIRIYQLLKQYKKIGYREFGVEELKEILGIEKGKYSQFKQFRQWVLNQAKKEFDKKSDAGFPLCDLTFKLETIREGRKIARVRFEIIPLKYQEALPFSRAGKILPVEPDRTEDQDIIERLDYYGISPLRGKAFISELGREKTEEILDYYLRQLAAGKVEKKEGAYLAYLLREKITGQSRYQKDYEEKAKTESRRSVAEQKKLQRQEMKERAAREKKLNAVYKKFRKTDARQQAELVEKFTGTLSPVLEKAFNENGIDSDIFRIQFLEFVEQYL